MAKKKSTKLKQKNGTLLERRLIENKMEMTNGLNNGSHRHSHPNPWKL